MYGFAQRGTGVARPVDPLQMAFDEEAALGDTWNRDATGHFGADRGHLAGTVRTYADAAL